MLGCCLVHRSLIFFKGGLLMFRGNKYCSLMIRGEKKTEKKLKAVESFFF